MVKQYLAQRICVEAELPHQCPTCGSTIAVGDKAAIREDDGSLLCMACHHRPFTIQK